MKPEIVVHQMLQYPRCLYLAREMCLAMFAKNESREESREKQMPSATGPMDREGARVCVQSERTCQ